MQKNENKTEIKTIELDTETAKIVNDKAKKEEITPQEALSRIIRKRLDELKGQEIAEKTFMLLKEVAKDKGKTPNQLLNEMLQRETIENQEFEENGVIYEGMTIDLPKQIADYYRLKAHLKGMDDLVETLIAYDICDNLHAEIESMDPTNFKEMFNLSPALDVMFNRQELMLRESPRSSKQKKA